MLFHFLKTVPKCYIGFLIKFGLIIFFNFISTIFYEFIVLITYKWGTLLSNAIAGKFQMIAFAFTTIILPEAVYNCVAAILLYIFMMKLNRKIESL